MNWIDVKKVKPEYSEPVLVSALKEYETGEVLYCVDIADRRFTNKDGDCWMNAKDDLKSWRVTHWQKLPEPPKL